ncbi:MAG: hypothetical protein DWH87_00955 [Planctomycetota bacterium]|nr:MAG: hypothetical protein DWH87_00955 [Planctomycetota bacterium]
MTNVMKVAMIQASQSLRSAGLSCRVIARRLGIHRETVARELRPKAVLVERMKQSGVSG